MKKMKKILASLMVVVIVLTAAPLTGFIGLNLDFDWIRLDWLNFNAEANAETYSGHCGDRPTWSLDTSTGELVISGTGSMTNYSYSSRVPWYSYRSSIKKVTIGNGVTSIGNHAFDDCKGITELTMPISAYLYNSYNTFYGCENIEKITLTKGNGTVRNYAGSLDYSNVYYQYTPWYTSRYKLKELIIEDGVTGIGDYTFFDCAYLRNITLPDSVTSIGDSAFKGCDSLTSITIPDSVKSIGPSAFRGCDSLTSITIPDSVTSIGDYAFSYCDSLTSITIPDSVTSIGDDAFSANDRVVLDLKKDSYAETYAQKNGVSYLCIYDGSEEKIISVTVTSKLSFDINKETYTMTIHCSGKMPSFPNGDAPWVQYKPYIKHIIINDGCTSISAKAFFEFKCIRSVIIPDSVTSIGEDVFKWCTGLTSVTIGNGVTSMGDSVFYYCISLENITVAEGNTAYSSDENGVLFNKVKTKLIQYPRGNTRTSYEIPDSVTSIGDSAFRGCTSLTSITIPDSVTSIGSYAFYACDVLASITIPDSVTSIGEYTFCYCYSLTSVTIGNGVRSIGNYAFYDCDEITELTMPVSAKIYHGGGYSGKGCTFDGCKNIKKITLTKGNGRVQDYGTSDSSSATNTLYRYTPSFISRDSLKELIIEDGVTGIGDYTFYGCTYLRNVTLPDSVTSIGDYTFYDCAKIDKITLPDNVTSIGDYAFYGCTNLGNITLPDSVKSIGAYAFSGCKNLERLEVYNRNCTFGTECISYYTTICGFAGSTAEAYANEMGLDFEPLEDDFSDILKIFIKIVDIIRSIISKPFHRYMFEQM